MGIAFGPRATVPGAIEAIEQSATGPNDVRRALAAAIICAAVATAVLIAAICLWIFGSGVN
jgi:hypothetical protein